MGTEQNPAKSLQAAIHDRLTKWLEAHDRSINWLAGQIGMAQTTLNGQFQRKSFSVEALDGAARAMGKSLEWVVRGAESPAADVAGRGGEGLGEQERALLIRLLEKALTPMEMALEELREGRKELSDHARRIIAQNISGVGTESEEDPGRGVANHK